MASILVLWDVDYTLVNTFGTGRRLYELAFAELYGRGLPETAKESKMAGRTDRAISLEVLTLAGVPDPRGQVSAFEGTLARLAPKFAGAVAETGRVLPGAAAAIAALAALSPDGAASGGDPRAGTSPHRAAVVQSVLTGNVREMAEVKLAPLGLTAHLDLDVGAYGNEHEIRAELVHLARRRAAAAYGREFGGRATVLVGDTPNDVEAALATGARAVAVATGSFGTDQLAAAGAHAVLPDLTDTAAVVAAVAPRFAEST